MSIASTEARSIATVNVAAWSLLAPALIALAIISVPACTIPHVQLTEGPREYVASDYTQILRLWTRSEQLTRVNELDNVLSVTATYESWDFRWAYVVRYAEDYRLTVDQRRALLERSLAETRETHQFYVALYAQRHKWNDLRAEDPAWIVRLIDDVGTETAPSDIEKIRRPGAIELTYFPYTSPWRTAYRISFPKVRADGRPTVAADAHWFGLRFAGAQGHDELVWEIRGESGMQAAASATSESARWKGFRAAVAP